jgi:hypothetical protein
MQQQPSSPEDLIHEITRYLAAVDLFRAERCEPTWRPELVPSPEEQRVPAEVAHVSPAH